MFREVNRADDSKLQRHVNATYFTLRWGIAVIAFLFPFILWLGGRLLGDLPLQGSMSAYYHAPEGAASGLMRDWFVGILFALGALMYLYKGFTNLENILLNVASVLAVGVAIFPMAWPEDSGDGGLFSLHGICAVGAFGCLALVAWLSPGRSLKLMPPGPKRSRYVKAFWIFGIFMLVFPVVAWLLTTILHLKGYMIFVVEALGLFAFVGYWVTKSLEMRDTQGELKALQGVIAPDS